MPKVLTKCATVGAFTLLAAHAAAQTDSETAPASKTGRFELKRQNTARGTPNETSATTLRAERYFDGPIAMLRLDLPFPDEKTDFAGSPFQPRPGDLKARLRFRSWQTGAFAFSPFAELTFPTADPESLGKGKYQLSAGLRAVTPVLLPMLEASAHHSTFEFEVQQTNSVAGDPAFKDVNNTKFEFTLFDTWQKTYTFKVKLKPTVDWVQNGRTGANAEIEGGANFARDWRWWLMLGARAWGPSGIANTYQTRVELGLNYTY